MQQFFAFFGDLPETVCQSFAVGVKLCVVLNVLQFTVKQHALAAAWHIALGEEHFHVAFNGAVVDKVLCLDVSELVGVVGAVKLVKFVVLELRYCLIEDFLVGLVA